MPIRLDRSTHTYTDLDTGEELPSVTQLLQLAGLVDTTWFTDAGRERGTAVHNLCAQHDLGALDLETCVSPYRGWLMGHIKAMSILRPEFLAIEESVRHEQYRFCGTPDRVCRLYGAVSVLEIKSGAPEKSHACQLSLQSILVAPVVGLPAESLPRYALYLKGNGKFHVEQFTNRSDFHQARTILDRFCT